MYTQNSIGFVSGPEVKFQKTREYKQIHSLRRKKYWPFKKWEVVGIKILQDQYAETTSFGSITIQLSFLLISTR